MGRGSFPIGSIAGIRITLHPTWIIVALLIALTMAAGELPNSFPGWHPAVYAAVGAGVAMLFFASVLAHELSHALVARRFGIGVSDITLFIFGGAATMEREAETPREEALVSVAGPACSLVVGAILVGLWMLLERGPFGTVVGWLGTINLALGLFNVIPAFPMDGGRILRALIWRWRGDRSTATLGAATIGRWFGYLLILIGMLLALWDLSNLWLALVGWFLTSAAGATLTQVNLQRSMAGVLVRDIMEPQPASISPNETVANLVNERLARGESRSFLVRHDDGGLAGIVTLSDVRRVARDDWAAARVTDIMTRYDALARIGPDDKVDKALEVLQEREVNQLPVVETDGRTVVGLLTRAGIVRLIDTRLKLGV
ncbi:MAG TPA: site-2 protease family protein [Candidatus Limnocylindria bacterium]|jgi:Zn-dependent protease/CBS domain-containing protein|nr:site-2 protease family protein [Candidatus Limnocylindria bacterium]